MPLACMVAGRCGRRRGLSACRLQPLWLAGAAVGEQRAHAVCIHWCWQEKPPVEPQHMLLACIVACRSCRRRKASRARRTPCTKRPGGSRQGGALVPRGLADQDKAEPLNRLHKLFLAGAASCLAGAAAGEQRAHAPCIHCCWQGWPPVKPQHRLLACVIACRSCRRRKASRARRRAS